MFLPMVHKHFLHGYYYADMSTNKTYVVTGRELQIHFAIKDNEDTPTGSCENYSMG